VGKRPLGQAGPLQETRNQFQIDEEAAPPSIDRLRQDENSYGQVAHLRFEGSRQKDLGVARGDSTEVPGPLRDSDLEDVAGHLGTPLPHSPHSQAVPSESSLDVSSQGMAHKAHSHADQGSLDYPTRYL